MFTLANIGKSELNFFQPGKSEVIELTNRRTIVAVVFGRIRIRAVGRRGSRYDAFPLAPVLIPPGQYIFESSRYSAALMRIQ